MIRLGKEEAIELPATRLASPDSQAVLSPWYLLRDLTNSITPLQPHCRCPRSWYILVKSRSQWWCCKSRCWLSCSRNQSAGMPGLQYAWFAWRLVRSSLVPKMCKHDPTKPYFWCFQGGVLHLRGMVFKGSKCIKMSVASGSCENVVCRAKIPPHHRTIDKKMQDKSRVSPKWYEIPRAPDRCKTTSIPWYHGQTKTLSQLDTKCFWLHLGFYIRKSDQGNQISPINPQQFSRDPISL